MIERRVESMLRGRARRLLELHPLLPDSLDEPAAPRPRANRSQEPHDDPAIVG
jgi:hypothetical protein